MSAHILVYITAPNAIEADRISIALLEDRLVACTNQFSQVTSRYWWDGKIEENGECVLIAKSREDFFKRIQKKVQALSSNSVPCVVSVPLTNGNPDFLKWIDDSTKL